MKETTLTSAQLAELQHCFQRINDILGLSISLADAHQSDAQRPSAHPRKRTAHRVTTATFTYRWLVAAPQRITMLYQHLLRAQWIAADTKPDDFLAIFSGEESTARVKWISKPAYLYYLIRRGVESQLISLPDGGKIWQITESHFTDSNSRPLHDLRKQKEPKTAIPAIEVMLKILEPSA